jgi:hypothetical protein
MNTSPKVVSAENPAAMALRMFGASLLSGPFFRSRTTRRFGDPFSVTILVTDACAQGAALSRKIAAYVVEFASWTKGMRRPPPATIRGRRDKSFDQGEAGPSSVAAIWRHGWACFLVSVRHRRQIISKRGNKYHKLLIYGARAALPSIAQLDTPLGR